MKERPILFSGEMVRAILDGRKIMTRRTKGLNFINENPYDWMVYKNVLKNTEDNYGALFQHVKTKEQALIKIPYGYKGDKLWVRETYCEVLFDGCENEYYYKADSEFKDKHIFGTKWKQSIFMPRVASRILLEITDVKLERLSEISQSDAINEGIAPEVTGDDLYENYAKVGYRYIKAKGSFRSLWESINGKESWEKNPWVWVISFKKLL